MACKFEVDSNDKVSNVIMGNGEYSPLFSKLREYTVENYNSPTLAYNMYIDALDYNGKDMPMKAEDEPAFEDIINEWDSIMYGSKKSNEIAIKLDTNQQGLVKNEEGYFYNGEPVTRVTTIVDERVYSKRFGKKGSDEQSKQEYSPSSILARTKGTINHAYREIVMREFAGGATVEEIRSREKEIKNKVIEMTHDDVKKEWEEAFKNNPKLKELNNDSDSLAFINDNYFTIANVRNNAINKTYYNDFVEDTKNLYDQIYDPAKIKERGVPKLYFEQKVFDKKNKLAGTIDLLVVYADGTNSIYDYKFTDMNYYWSRKEKKWKTNKSVPDYKIEAYNVQLNEYRNILRNAYGVKKFGEFRIVPTGVSYNTGKNKNGTEKKISEQVQGFRHIEFGSLQDKKVRDEYLKQIPANTESTGIEQLDMFIRQLREIENKMTKQLEKNYRNEELKEKRDRLRSNINSILLENEITDMVEYMEDMLRYTEDIVDEGVRVDSEGKEAESLESHIRKLSRQKEILNAFKLYQTFSSDILKKNEEVFNDPAQRDAYYLHSKHLEDWIRELSSKLNSSTIRHLSQATNVDLNKEYKELGMGAYIKSYSQLDNPHIQALRNILYEKQMETRRETIKLQEHIQKHHDKVKEWAKKNNMSLDEANRKLINEEKGSLVGVISQEFYDERKERIKDGDINWLKANHEITDKWKEKYKELRDKKLEFFHSIYTNQDIINARMADWDAKNNLNNRSAWLNERHYQYYNVKLTDKAFKKYETEEHKYLSKKGNEELMEAYKFLKDMNYEFQNMLQVDINSNFIPNIRKNFVEQVMKNGAIAPKESFNDFLDSIKSTNVYQDEVSLTDTSKMNSIPIFYMNKIDPKQKSFDLFSNMLIFGNMAYNVKNMRDIEYTALGIRDMLAENSNAMISDSRGNVIKDNLTNEFKKKAGVDNITLDIYKKIMNNYIYQRKIQNKDTDIGGFSLNRILLKLMSYMSMTTLGLNIKSAGAAAIGATANSYMNGTKGIYYTNKQLKNAWKMMSNGTDRQMFHLLSHYFHPEKENWVMRDADKLRTDKIRTKLTNDKVYILQQTTEEFLAETIMVAMMQNHGIDENGKIMKLSMLPEGSKSLLERSSEKDNKLVIEGMTETNFNQFRRKVQTVISKTKGSVSDEDISAIQTHVLGRLLIHYRRWIAPMIQERFGGMRYDVETQEYEVGRYKVFLGEFYNKKILDNAKNIGRILLDVGLGSVPYIGEKFRMSPTNSQYMLDKYLVNAPESDLAQRIAKDEITYEEALQEYTELRRGQLRAMMVELRMALLIYAGMMAAGADWDDDDVKWYNEFPMGKTFYDMLVRTHGELTFFLLPTSVDQILKSPIPLLGLISNITAIGTNGVDETLDYLFGEPIKSGKNKGKLERQRGDRTDFLHYTKRTIPFVRPVLDVFESFVQHDEKNK